MMGKKRKSARQTTNLTVDGDSLTVFNDKPRGNNKTTSPGVVTSYDPAVTALAERLKLVRILEDCLRTAGSIKTRRGTELVTLLRDARRRIELIDLK